MTVPQANRVGKRGAIILPARLRKRFGIEEGSIVLTEETEDGILIWPMIPVESYTPARKAEFLLANATNKADYLRARKAVKALGMDPEKIPHNRL